MQGRRHCSQGTLSRLRTLPVQTLTSSKDATAILGPDQCLVLGSGGNSETVRIAGAAPAQTGEPAKLSCPAGSTLTLLDGASAPSNTSMAIMRGLVEAGATSMGLLTEAWGAREGSPSLVAAVQTFSL